MKGGAHTPEESAILLQARLRESGRFDRLADREKAQDILAKSEDRYSPHEIEKIETELAEHGLSFNKGTIESPAGLEIRKRIDDAKEQVATKERRERSQKADAWKELVNTDDWVSGDPTVFEQDNVLPRRADVLRHLGEISLAVRGPVNFGGSSQGRGPNKSDVTFDTLGGPSKVSDGRGGWTWSPEVIPRISLINLIYAMHKKKPPTGSDQQPYPKDIAGVTQIVGQGVLLSRGDEILSLLDQWIDLLDSGENVPIWAEVKLNKSGLEKCKTLRLLLKRIIENVKFREGLKEARKKKEEIKEKDAQLEIERKAERAREEEEKVRQEKKSADAFNEKFDRRARLRKEEKLAADQAKKEALRVKEEERIALQAKEIAQATEDARLLQVAWKLKKETQDREYAEKKRQENEEKARLKQLEDAKKEAHKKLYDSEEEVAKRDAANLLIRQQEAEEVALRLAIQKQIDEDNKVRLNKEEAVRLGGVAREHYDQGLIQEEQSQKAESVEAATKLEQESKENFKEAVKTLNEAKVKDNTNKDVLDLLALAIVKAPPVSSFKSVFDSDSDD